MKPLTVTLTITIKAGEIKIQNDMIRLLADLSLVVKDAPAIIRTYHTVTNGESEVLSKIP